jgi:hypothetical protein
MKINAEFQFVNLSTRFIMFIEKENAHQASALYLSAQNKRREEK